MSTTSDDEDFDHCGMAQDDTKFSHILKSPYCPKVGACGHSFCDKSLQDWFQARKKDGHHGNATVLPCPYKCSETKKLKKGKKTTTVLQEIDAFRPSKLVPNHSLCQAVKVIRHVQGKKKSTAASKKAAETFDQCPKCHAKYSTEPKSGELLHPQTAIVGRCGHTVCFGCLEKIFKSKRKAIKHVPCPTCKQGEAFYADQFVENIDFGKALRHWKTLVPDSKPAAKPTVPSRKVSAKKAAAKKVQTKKPAAAKKSPAKKAVVTTKKSATTAKKQTAAAKKKSESSRKSKRARSSQEETIGNSTGTPNSTARPNKRSRRGNK